MFNRLPRRRRTTSFNRVHRSVRHLGTMECLEARQMLAVTWVEQGPFGADLNQNVLNLAPNDRTSGAIHTVLAHPTNANTLYAGGVNGGIWKTTNAAAASPTWTPQSDFLGSLSIGAMDFDPTDATQNTLVAGTGNYSSFASVGGTVGAVYRTTDGANWTTLASAGLAGNRISGIAARGTDIVVTSDANPGGIFRSTDGGATFTAITGGGISANENFTDLVVDISLAAGTRLYAANAPITDGGGPGAGPGAIYRSDNFGATWTAITSGTIEPTMNGILAQADSVEMAVSPQSGRLYAGLIVKGQLQAIYYSDTASTATVGWTQMDIPVLPQGTGIAISGATNANPIEITSAVPLASDPSALKTGHRVLIKDVGGNSAANGVFTVTVTGASTFTLNGADGTSSGAYTPGTGTWVRVNSVNPKQRSIEEGGSQGKIHFSIAVSPTNPNLLFVGGDTQEIPSVIGAGFQGALFRGDASIAPGGANAVPSPQWDHLTHQNGAAQSPVFDASGGTASNSAPHADSREIVFDAVGNLIEAGDGGVTKRTSPNDNTGDWFNLATTGTSEFHSIAYDSLSNTVLAGAQDNGVPHQTTAGQLTWAGNLNSGDGGDPAVDNISLAGSNQSVRYTGSQNLAPDKRSVFDATGALVSAENVTLTVGGGGAAIGAHFLMPVKLNQANPPSMTILGSNSIYESTNFASDGMGTFTITLSEVGVGLGSEGGAAMDYGTTTNPHALYVGQMDQIHVRLGAAPAAFTSTTLSTGGDVIKEVVIDPANDQNAFAVDQNQVFRTTNAGSTWTEVTGDIMSLAGSFLQTIEFIPGPLGAVVVGGALGVFSATLPSLGASTAWTEVGAAVLPNAIVYDLDYNIADNVLVAGTFGRGAWMAANANELAGAAAAPTVESVVLDDGTTQRSMIRSAKVTFSQEVILAAGAITLTRSGSSTPVTFTQTPVNMGGKTMVTLTFSGIGGSLEDGRYTLTIDKSKVSAGSTNMAADRTDNFFRYFGDKTGGAVPTVDSADIFELRKTIGKPSTDAAFDDDFDFNGDGAVDPLDLFQFRIRIGKELPLPAPAAIPVRAAAPRVAASRSSAFVS